MSDNFVLAKKRLFFEKKFPEKACMYNRALEEYLNNGWVVSLTTKALQADVNPVYYLPHHGVYRPDKESMPLSLVFYLACVFKGVSLNSPA